MFIIPLDERQGWYRFHHLFQQLLQQRLQEKSSAEELALLHRRASRWYAEQGLIEEAIEHALEAGDASGATQLVEAHFLPAFKREQLVQVELWLRLLPEEQIQGSPVLLFAKAWILQAQGQLKDLPRLLTTAEQLLDASSNGVRNLDDPHSRLLHALIATAWSLFQYFTGKVQASMASARSALEWLPPGEEYVASIALVFLAWSNQACGQEDIALVALQQALRDHSTHLNSTARLLYAQAWVYLAAGKLHQVEHTARHLLRLAQQAELALSQYWAHWLLGLVYYEWNNLDAAVYHFSAVVANQHQAHFWVVRDAMCGLALAYQAQGLDAQAQETAQGLLELVQEQHNIRELMTAYAFSGRLALLQDEVEQAGQWLELAGEQEVLGPMMFLEDPPITMAWMLLAKGDEVSVAHGQALLTHSCSMSKPCTIHARRSRYWPCKRGRTICKVVRPRRSRCWNARLPWRVPVGSSAPLPIYHRWSTCFTSCASAARHDRRSTAKLDTYLQDLLAAMSSRVVQPVSTEALLRQEGLEPLTDRELQILRLLDKDLTNKEIARELVLTTGTVKVHTSNVYRKLSVNNRRAAVSLAKALGFLGAS